MKMLLLGIALSTSAAMAVPLASELNCQQAANLVVHDGALVLRTSEDSFERYVSSLRSCAAGESLVPAFIAALDSPRCFVGYTCERLPGGQ